MIGPLEWSALRAPIGSTTYVRPGFRAGLLVKRLEQDGLVTRERQADDGRVVLVKPTDAGIAALEDYRAQAGAALGTYLTEMPDHQIQELAAATKTLAQLVTVLQQAATT